MKTKFKRHISWNKLIWVVGYIDSYDKVHAKIVLQGDPYYNHYGLFKNNFKYKNWRWSKSEGLMSSQCVTELTEEDWESVRNWLFNNGCLNDWEL